MKRRRNILSWVGFAVVLAAVASYVPIFALFPATRDVPWVNYLLFLIGGALLALGIRRAFRAPERYRGKISGSILAALSLLAFASFIATVAYLGKQIPSGATALGVSRKAPPFTLVDAAGKQVSSAALLSGRRGLVLVFYRGYW